jgi:hypothetical protein
MIGNKEENKLKKQRWKITKANKKKKIELYENATHERKMEILNELIKALGIEPDENY